MLRFVRNFQTSAARRVAVGDKVPSAVLLDGAPSATVNLAEATAKGKYLAVGVPGAFSPGCSQRHIPGFLEKAKEFKAHGVKHIYVITVNDSFVTSAWKSSLFGNSNSSEVEDYVSVLADHSGEFSRDWDTLFDATKFFGSPRSKRYAALIEDGTVVKTFVEPDSTGINDSEASKVITQI